MEILVFKTNLTDTTRISEIKDALDVHPLISKWNVDLHDEDKILRIVTETVSAGEIEQLVTNAGYYCEEIQ
jgi:cell fate (sporulation/competence/biofilm development) regulator YmcA (YheA/YmcA/DUF963 family)